MFARQSCSKPSINLLSKRMSKGVGSVGLIFTLRALQTPQVECIYIPLRGAYENKCTFLLRAVCVAAYFARSLHLSLCYSWALDASTRCSTSPLNMRSCFIRDNRKQTGCFGKPLNWKWETERFISWLRGDWWMNKHQLHCFIAWETPRSKKCNLFTCSCKSYQKILITREIQTMNNF